MVNLLYHNANKAIFCFASFSSGLATTTGRLLSPYAKYAFVCFKNTTTNC